MESPNEKKVPVRDIMPNVSANVRSDHSVESSGSASELPRRARASRAEFFARKPERLPASDMLETPRRWGWMGGFRFPWKITAASIGFLAAAGLAVSAFSKTVVIITPRAEQVAVVMTVSVGGSAGLAAQVASAEETLSMRAKSSGMEDISERATGRILIYNAYSALPQALVRRTRFETADGKVYRLTEAVTVPGATVLDGKIEPSFVEAAVAADLAGEASNIGITDFTIPGFKGGAKYEKFYAHSKTPMTGGFAGRTAVIREEDVQNAKQSLERDLKNTLTTRLNERLGQGLIIPADAATYTIAVSSVEPAIGERGDAFDIRVTGQAAALAVRRQDLEKQLLERYGKTALLSHPEIRNFGDLAVRATASDPVKKAMTLSVTGDMQLVWGVSMDELKKGLLSAAGVAGRNAVFASYPQIERVRVSYRPSWWRIFPRSEDKIVVEEDLEL